MNDVHYSSVHHVFAVSLFAVRKTETIKDLDETNFWHHGSMIVIVFLQELMVLPR